MTVTRSLQCRRSLLRDRRGSRIVGASAVTMLMSCLLTACAASPPPYTDASEPLSPEVTTTEMVERRTFDTVLSLPATVVSGLTFQVTAPASGSVVEHDDALAVRLDSGREVIVGERARIERLLVEPGAEVVAGLPLAEAVHEGFVLRAPVTAEELLRLSASMDGAARLDRLARAEGEVLGSSGPFDCDLVDPVPSSTDPALVQEGDSFLACVIPASVRVLTGMTGQLVVTLASHEDVLSLPLEAVAGTVDHARVSVREGDEIVEREITLGGSNGYVVEIIEGLREGDEVLVPSPSLLE